MATSLGRIFNSGIANKIEVLYDEVQNSGLLEPVGTTAFALKEVTIDAKKGDLKVFDLAADLEANAKAAISIAAGGASIAPFDPTQPLEAPANSSYARLHIEGKLSADASGNVTPIPLELSASGAASFSYDHYLPVAATDRRAEALARLVGTAQLPQFEPLMALQPGEVSKFQAALNLDLGLKGTYGRTFDIEQTLELFDGLSGQFKANVGYSLEGALGWSIFDDMDLTVAHAQTDKPGWVRVRIERSHKNSFTAGATFALQINYDASSLGDALEKAFDMTPLPRAIDVLKQVSSMTWDDVKAKVTDRAATELIALVAGTGWKEMAADSEEVKTALKAINDVIRLYDDVEPKVRQLWSSLLLRAGLQDGSELRKAIDSIAALDPANPNLQQFLSPTAQKDLELLESLTGKSVEQLLVGSNTGIGIAIAQSVSLAKQLQTVLTETPDKINGALQQFTEKSGVKSAIAWLAANATSLDAIQASGGKAIQNLVAKAVGKALGAATPKDIEAVQAWAKRLLAQWDQLSTRLAAAAKFLKGAIGFSVSLEYSRVTETSAMLDFEFDPTNSSAAKAVMKQLPSGSVQDMLAALDTINPDATGALPFSIRESIIVSRHVRTGATTVLLSFLGLQNLQKITGSRLEESTIRVINDGRQATFSGGFVQAVTAGAATSECGAWISTDATATTKDLNAPYEKAERSMRLTFARKDPRTNAEERNALQNLLVDLGFFQTEGTPVTAPDGAETAFTLDISLSAEAASLFAADADETNWNNDYRNAAFRLLKDDMVTDRLAAVGEPLGEVLAAVVKDDQFGSVWKDTSQVEFIKAADSADGFGVNGKRLRILNDQNRVIPPYLPLQMMIVRRPRGLDDRARLATALASNGMTQDDFRAISSAAAALFRETSFPNWDNPMFNFWFVVARLVRLAKTTNVLQNATGLATFRFRTSATDAFSAPVQWTLTKDVGVSVSTIASRQLFPFA
ncbi:MAG TPA: hypothetical protein VGF48_01230 [Thermoanaerobaculia bacterium]|jgi:hypothetical protein